MSIKKHPEAKKAYLATKEQGKKYGRPEKALPENFSLVYSKWKEGEITGMAAAAECGMPLSTFRYRAEQQEAESLNQQKGTFGKRRCQDENQGT